MFKKNKDILNIALPAMGENFFADANGNGGQLFGCSFRIDSYFRVSVAGNIITIYQAIFIALGAAISSVISKA